MAYIGYRYHHRKKGWYQSCSSYVCYLRSRQLSELTCSYRQPRYNEIRNIPQRNAASDAAAKLPTGKKETPFKETPSTSGADLPGISTSKIDVDAKPIYEPAGKPITQVNIDEGKLGRTLGGLWLIPYRFE
jgi:hypothetical protein